MATYNEDESERLFRSCEELIDGKKERTDDDLGLLMLCIIAAETRSALCDAIDDRRAVLAKDGDKK